MSSYMPELEPLRIDHDHPHIVRRRAIEDAGQHRVEADRLARAGRAGDQQVRHRREVRHVRLAVNGLAEREGQLRRRARVGVGLEQLAQRDRFAIRIRNLDADGRLAGNAIDQHRLGLHRQAQVVGEAGDLRVLHAGVGLELERRDDRARDESARPSPRPRTRGTSPRAAAPSPSARARRSCARPSAASSSDAGGSVYEPSRRSTRSGSGSGSGGATGVLATGFFCTTGGGRGDGAGAGRRPRRRRAPSRARRRRLGLLDLRRSSCPALATTGVSFLPYLAITSRRCLRLAPLFAPLPERVDALRRRRCRRRRRSR